MLNKIVPALALCGLFALGVADLAPAQARDRYVAGGFSVGGLYFEFARTPDWPTGSYLRVAGSFDHGSSCNRFCYRDRGQYYHHRSCPALRGHFAHYRPELLVVLGSGGYGYPRYERQYDGYDRYDEHSDRRHGRGYDEHYDDERGDDRRGRGHKHGKHCNH